MKLQIKVDAHGIIEDVRFKTFGCGSAIASSSLATEWIKGKSLEEASKIRNTDIARELSLPPVKLHCSSKMNFMDILILLLLVLAEDAIKSAVKDYQRKQMKSD